MKNEFEKSAENTEEANCTLPFIQPHFSSIPSRSRYTDVHGMINWFFFQSKHFILFAFE